MKSPYNGGGNSPNDILCHQAELPVPGCILVSYWRKGSQRTQLQTSQTIAQTIGFSPSPQFDDMVLLLKTTLMSLNMEK